jgi:acetylornithine deacetylase
VPTVICGPGSMAQGHKPDEYVTVEQIDRCQAMLAALVQKLAAGF